MSRARRVFCLVFAATLAAALAAAPAQAHEFWLRPSRFVCAAGETVAVRALVGEHLQGMASPYRRARTLRFELLEQDSTARDLRLLADENGDPWVQVALTSPGGAHVVYESKFASITLDGSRFEAYLEEEGLDVPRAARVLAGTTDSTGRERYRRCVKAWLHPPSDVVPPSLGLEYEIASRGPLAARDSLVLEVRFRGEPLANALLRAWREGSQEKQPARQARSDAQGRIVWGPLEPGVWLLHSVHMVPCPHPAVADWESYWTAWTFEVVPPQAMRSP
jgi:hypothetical protein